MLIFLVIIVSPSCSLFNESESKLNIVEYKGTYPEDITLASFGIYNNTCNTLNTMGCAVTPIIYRVQFKSDTGWIDYEPEFFKMKLPWFEIKIDPEDFFDFKITFPHLNPSIQNFDFNSFPSKEYYHWKIGINIYGRKINQIVWSQSIQTFYE